MHVYTHVYMSCEISGEMLDEPWTQRTNSNENKVMGPRDSARAGSAPFSHEPSLE